MARFKLRPLFGRSKTASSTTSEPASLAQDRSTLSSTSTTAADTTADTSPANSQIISAKRSAVSLQQRPGQLVDLAPQSARSASEHDLSRNHHRRSLSGPAVIPRLEQQVSSGTELSELSSVEEDEREDKSVVQEKKIEAKHEIELPGPALVLQRPTPPALQRADSHSPNIQAAKPIQKPSQGPSASPSHLSTLDQPTRLTSLSRSSSGASPKHISRPQSLVESTNAPVRKTGMPRKIWVRRPGASATLINVKDDDVVDDVRDMILRKYANSLGRTIDAPDMALRLIPRSEHGAASQDRLLGVEEDICALIDATYPGGQTVDEALLIDVPTRRTPKPSPRAYQQHDYHAMDSYRPVESGNSFFPPVEVVSGQYAQNTAGVHFQDNNRNGYRPSIGNHDMTRSMAVLTTGQLPLIPSPGSTSRRSADRRPKIPRQHTSSPTIINQHNAPLGTIAMTPLSQHLPPPRTTRHRTDSSASDNLHHTNGVIPPAPALPTPPAPEAPPTGKGSTPPTPSTMSASLAGNRAPRPRKARKVTPEKSMKNARRNRRGSEGSPAKLDLPISSMLDATFPPINVLLVEDNNIALRVLEGFMKRLKVRWDSASNGQIAVDKWRKGGYHLILMDIQMPVMNGLEATKEIRRLEKVNGIGVFSSSAPTSPEEVNGVNGEGDDKTDVVVKDPAADKLSISEGTFKSPIIIVALTASNLQSDRHQALTAGCNDFLTKPLNMSWLERKVKEWGCMQALIDFDGWKRWREINEKEEAGKSDEQKRKEKEQGDAQKKKLEKMSAMQEKQWADKKTANDKKKAIAAKRTSTDSSAAATPISGRA